jgi:uncharacterized protein
MRLHSPAAIALYLCVLDFSARPCSAEPRSPTQVVTAAAEAQTAVTRYYDPRYVQLRYPLGDPQADRGVCSDVIVRAFRAGGVDLQQAVHEDMRRHFALYPHRWGLRAPDANIDHRRVANLMIFFERHGKAQPISREARDYRPGDVVAWDLGGGLLHLGLVSAHSTADGDPLIVHNIGAGARLEDVLFQWRIIGHYRYF